MIQQTETVPKYPNQKHSGYKKVAAQNSKKGHN